MASSSDREFFERTLRAFVPPGSFDAHAHLYRQVDANTGVPAHLADPSGNVGLSAWAHHTRDWMGDRAPTAGLFFPFPKRDVDSAGANRYLIDELRDAPASRGLWLARPSDDPQQTEAAVRESRLAGFKVYHLFAARPDTFNAGTEEFLPDWIWEIAHRHGLAIMLHLVRPRALADVANQQYIRERCLRFPGARLILAHAARGFCGRHTVEGIESLRGLDNVWFDTSAICEPDSFEAILRTFGPTRLLFGSDFPVSEVVGRCVSIADGFLWLDRQNVNWDSSPFAQPMRVGIESLLALQQACRTARLNDRDIERVFGGNARQLLGLSEPVEPPTAQDLYRAARQTIPGGTQLLSKRPEMFAPDRWPAYYREAHGCEIIDVDERRYIDMTTAGIGSCLLGYADPDVTDAVVRRVQLGAMSTLNAPEEYELARLLIELHPWAQQVRYCRTGGEAMAVAVRIARAASRRDVVAFCGYHGWSDWYLAANLRESGPVDGDALRDHLLPGLAPNGVPAGLTGTALPFRYDDIDGLRQIVREHGPRLAAVVMEPTRSTDPQPGFLEAVRELCDTSGAALVFDEITAGWRLHFGGAHLKYGIVPDVAVFGKALGNGHPMAAIIGRERVMSAAQESFISSTYWTEAVGPAAALATLRKMQRIDVPAHVERMGRRYQDGWLALAREHSLDVAVSGHPCLLHLSFRHEESAALGTLLTARMLDRGFLVGSGYYPCLAHEERHVDACLVACDPVFAEIADALRTGDVRERLGTPVRHGGFSRLT